MAAALERAEAEATSLSLHGSGCCCLGGGSSGGCVLFSGGGGGGLGFSGGSQRGRGIAGHWHIATHGEAERRRPGVQKRAVEGQDQIDPVSLISCKLGIVD